ncbi:MAG: Wzz/FepE/Etk N-terminal domain-containing protein [Methyloglobulus sp.]|nr:hypothetical protein [Methyloglobulus sp.]
MKTVNHKLPDRRSSPSMMRTKIFAAPPPLAYQTFSDQQQDVIDLLEVWQLLVKRKKIIFQITLVSLMLGIGYSAVKPEKYAYHTMLQIGTLMPGQPKLIESPQDVFNKVKSAYIPLTLDENRKTETDTKTQPKFEDILPPKDTNLLKLEMHCKLKDEQLCKSLINGVIQKITLDHSRMLNISEKNLSGKLKAAENALKNSKDLLEYSLQKKKRLTQTAELITNQLKEKKAMLEKNLKNRSSIKSSSAAGAMSILLIDNAIQSNQTLIDNLEKQLYINLGQEQDNLEKAEKDNIRHQSEQQNAIDEIKNLLLSINNTEAIVPVLRSENPVGTTPTVIVTLSLLFGLCAGLLAVFLLEFTGRVNSYNKSASESALHAV